MKTIKLTYALSIALLCLFAASCKKDDVTASTVTNSSALGAVIAYTEAIAVGTASATSTSAADSIYVVNTCSNNQHRDSISFSSLPATVTNYLSANYNNYTAQKAFTVKDNSGTIQGYIVILQYNGNPVGLKFDASGNFVAVLEQREGRDLAGRGWHRGGHFDDRDGRNNDTVAVSSLPAAIQNYFSSNYPQDTIIRVCIQRDSSYVVFSKDNGAFATIFNPDGTFVKRIQLPADNHASIAAVSESGLPASIVSYLTTTYPAYVFKEALSVSHGGTVHGYIVYINSNSTLYGLAFDASGNLIKTVAIK